MKYCPYCGASLMGGAASFCAECGKPLPAAAKPSEPPTRPHQESRPPKKRPPGGRIPTRPPQPPGRHAQKRQAHPANAARRAMTRPDPRDEGYDGYYDDVKPVDGGQVSERSDPELMKRVILIAAGAVALVILSAILMYLL